MPQAKAPLRSRQCKFQRGGLSSPPKAGGLTSLSLTDNDRRFRRTNDSPMHCNKLLFAESTKLRDNDDYSEKNSDSLKDRKSDREDSKKCRKTQDYRGGLRKARVSPGRRKGKAR